MPSDSWQHAPVAVIHLVAMKMWNFILKGLYTWMGKFALSQHC
jgi:hypothetical protein